MRLYVGLGANIGDRAATIRQAIRALGERIGAPAGCSALFETRPVGFASPHLFLNAVAAFDTELSPDELLAATQDVERQLGRRAKSVDGVYHDRTIDIDLLVLGDTVTASAALTLPHPRLGERRFVLEPLCELAPSLVLPDSGLTAAALLRRLNVLTIAAVRPEEAAEAAEALNRLLPALTDKARPLAAADVAAMLRSGLTHVYLGRDEAGLVQATATLCLCASPTGKKAWVEDVVVHPDCRGRGYGRALIDHLKAESMRLGAASLNLTSRPDREAANRLYRRAGFALRTTNVYRLTPDAAPTTAAAPVVSPITPS